MCLEPLTEHLSVSLSLSLSHEIHPTEEHEQTPFGGLPVGASMGGPGWTRFEASPPCSFSMLVSSALASYAVLVDLHGEHHGAPNWRELLGLPRHATTFG